MADTVYYNPTLGLQNITPALDDETFLFFLSAYYDWMQTTDITFNGASGAFSNGEIITGQDSRATATIRYVGSNTITVSMKTEIPFDLGEEFVGGTSANSAFVLELSDNVLRKASHLRENKNNEKAQGQFLEYLKGELNKGMPVKTSADRRRLIAQLKEFFRSKSTEEAYTFLFRALFNETIEIRYPGDDLLRVSDGNFLKQSTIRINERGAFQLGGEANVVSGNALVIGSNTDFTDFSTSDYFKIGTQQAVVSNVINATHMLATTNFTTTANNQFVYELIPTDIFQLKNKTIKGRTSGAIGVVADVRASTLGGKPYADVILRLISGGFEENEIIEDIENPSSNVIVYGVVSGININDGGTGYAVDDEVIITGDGLEATAKITSVSQAPITQIILANTGIGYQNNLDAVVNNTGTGGTGFAVRISEIANTYTVGANNEYTVGDTVSIRIVNRGSGYVALPTITLQDTAVASLGLLHEKLIRIDYPGSTYGVGNTLVFTGGSGSNAAGQIAAVTERWAETPANLVATEQVLPYKDDSLLDDFGSNTVTTENEVGILLEQSYYDRVKTEDWRGIGPIERLELTNFGTGYTSNNLPTVTVDIGFGDDLIATWASNTISTLASEPIGFGSNLTDPAVFTVLNIQGKSAVINIDASNNIAGIGSIREVTILNQGIDYTTATIDASAKGDGNANLTAEIGGLFVDSGRFTNDDGKVNYKILQDSLFYQDFSYVIRSGLSFDRYKEIIKEVVHPAGLEFFGEIVITSTISLAANFGSEIAADTAPRFASLFSFLSLFEGIGLPPPVQSSIIVRINPVVSYTNQAKAEASREVEVELNPIVITAPSVISSTDPRLKGPLQFNLGPIDVSADFVFSRTKGEKSLPPVFVTTSSSFVPTEYNVEILSFVNVEPTIIPFEDISANVSIPKRIETVLNTQSALSALYEIDIQSDKRQLPIIWGDTRLLNEYAGTRIEEISEQRFGDTEYPAVDPAIITLINEPSYVDVSMAFFTTIVTMETDVKSVKIDINLLASVSSTISTKYEIDIVSEVTGPTDETYGDQNFYFYSNPGPTEFIVLSTEPISDYASNTLSEFSGYLISGLYTQDTIIYDTIGKWATTEFDEPLYAGGKNILSTHQEVNIEIPSYADLSMAFYSIVTTAETDIRSVELDINLLQNVSASIATQYRIELAPTRLTTLYKDLPIDAIKYDPVEEYSTFTFNTVSKVTYPNVRAFLGYSIVELDLPPTYTNVTMAFYNNIVTMQNEIRTTEIDIELFKSVSSTSTSKIVIDIMLGDRYKNESISEYSDQSISKYDDEIIQDKVAIGRAGFVNGKRNFVYGDARLRDFWNFAIEDAEPNTISGNNTFNDTYGNDTVRKHYPIGGTVSVSLQDLGNVPLFNLASDPINNYASSTFNDPSGLRPVIIGSNTQFTNDFDVGDYIVIGDEKFIVKDVGNTEYLEINVSATQNYTNVPAYREIFV